MSLFASRVESLTVRWPDGASETFDGAGANALLELTRGADGPHRVAEWSRGAPLSREQLAEFWRHQRSAMNAMKVDGDLERAIGLFGQALELNPVHEDSLYYLGNCLAETGNVQGALARFAELMRLNPQSHRAHKRWGTLRAATARDPEDLDAAVVTLERAASINPEESGVSLVLGEVELLRGNTDAAHQRLGWVVDSNPQAGEAFFVLAYLAWAGGDPSEAARLLERAAGTRTEDWKPSGVFAEGEVRRKMHVESTLFEDVYGAWDGTADPDSALAPLQATLDARGVILLFSEKGE